MLWKSHQVVTAVTVYAATRNVPATVITTAASVFPDWIEFYVPFTRWESIHRTYSHFWMFYFFSLVFLYHVMNASGIPIFTSVGEYISALKIFKSEVGGDAPFYMVASFFPLFCNIGFWFLIGCLMHIAEDAICGRIPILRPTQRAHIVRIFYTGGISEGIFVGLYTLILGLFILKSSGPPVVFEQFSPSAIVQKVGDSAETNDVDSAFVDKINAKAVRAVAWNLIHSTLR